MAVTFPENPDVGQQFLEAGKLFVWDGNRWVGQATTQGVVLVSPQSRNIELIDDNYPRLGEASIPPLTFALLDNVNGGELETIKKDSGSALGYFPRSNTLFTQQLLISPAIGESVEDNYSLIVDDDEDSQVSVRFTSDVDTVFELTKYGTTTTGVTTTPSVDTQLVLTYENATFGRVPDTGGNNNAGETTPKLTELVAGYHLQPLPLAQDSGFYLLVENDFDQLAKIVYDVTAIFNNGTRQTMCYDEITFLNIGYNTGTTNEFVALNKRGQTLDTSTTNVSEDNYIPSPDCRIEAFTRGGLPALILMNNFAGDGIFTVNITARKTILPA